MVTQASSQVRKEKRIPDWLFYRSPPKSPPEFNFFGGGTIRQMLESQNKEMQVVKKRIGYVACVTMLTLAFLIVTKLPSLIAASRLTNTNIGTVEPHVPVMKPATNSSPDGKPTKKTEMEPAPKPAQFSTTPPPNPVQATGVMAPVGNVRPAPEVNPQKVETPAPSLSPVPPARASSPDMDSKSATQPAVENGTKTASPIDAPAGPTSVIEVAPSTCASPQPCTPPSCVGRIRVFFRFRLLGMN